MTYISALNHRSARHHEVIDDYHVGARGVTITHFHNAPAVSLPDLGADDEFSHRGADDRGNSLRKALASAIIRKGDSHGPLSSHFLNVGIKKRNSSFHPE